MEEDLFVLGTIGLQISLEAALIQLGYSDLESVSSGMRDKVGAEIAKTQSLMEPKGSYLRLQEAWNNTQRNWWEPARGRQG